MGLELLLCQILLACAHVALQVSHNGEDEELAPIHDAHDALQDALLPLGRHEIAPEEFLLPKDEVDLGRTHQ